MIVLDTNAVIAAINPEPSPVRSRLAQALHRGSSVWLSSVVLFELRYGMGKSARREHNSAQLVQLMASLIRAVAFDPEDAAEAGDIRAALERAGTSIGYYDLLIAAQARRRGALLITANTREFARVPGLQIDNWSMTLN